MRFLQTLRRESWWLATLYADLYVMVPTATCMVGNCVSVTTVKVSLWKPTHLYFKYHGYPMELRNPTDNTIVFCEAHNNCLSNDASKNCFYDEALSNETVAAFIVAKATRGVEGTWRFYHDKAGLMERVQLSVTEPLSDCQPFSSLIPVFTCSKEVNQSDTSITVATGDTVRVFCPIKPPMNLDGPGGLNTVVECSSSTNCNYNYRSLSLVLDPYCSDSVGACFLIYGISRRHSGVWNYGNRNSCTDYNIRLNVLDANEGCEEITTEETTVETHSGTTEGMSSSTTTKDKSQQTVATSSVNRVYHLTTFMHTIISIFHMFIVIL